MSASRSYSSTPTFHLCPDFNIHPSPEGPLQLGTIITGLDVDSILAPLNNGATITVPEEQIHGSEKQGFKQSLRDLRKLQGSIWATIFSWEGLGAMFSALRGRADEETLTVEKLPCRYFVPTLEYINKALEVQPVAYYVRNANFRVPIYMITGIMWTEGAKLSKVRSKKANVDGQLSAMDPSSGVGGGASGGYEAEAGISTSFDGSTPFILGFRVHKISWDRAGVRKNKSLTAGAAFGARGPQQADLSEGLQFAEEEADRNKSAQLVLDETELEEENPVIWVFP